MIGRATPYESWSHGVAHLTLLQQMLAEENLLKAWQRVRSNQGMAGSDGLSIRRTEEVLAATLQDLREEIEQRQYQPLPLLELMVKKPDGGERRLAVPTVRDRIVQTAAALVLSPLLEKGFEDSSYAYRPGRSVADAIAQVARFREQHYLWVVDADIRKFFDEINHELLLGRLRKELNDHSLLPLIELWLAAIMQPESGERYLLTKGVVQGSPISPLLSNLYLDELDELLKQQQFHLVRYADDFLILCRSRAEAEQALQLTCQRLEALALTISREKSRIIHFSEGFTFLGVSFHHDLMEPVDRMAGRWLIPERHEWDASRVTAAEKGVSSDENDSTPADSAIYYADQALRDRERVADSDRAVEGIEPEGERDDQEAIIRYEENPALTPLLRSAIISTQGVTLLKEGERMLAVKGGAVRASVPLHRLDQLVLQGNQLISTALLRFADDHDIAITFTDRSGHPKSSLLDDRGLHLQRHRQQFKRDESLDFKLGMAAEWVAVKLHNSRVLIRTHNRRRQLDEVTRLLSEMEKMQSQLATAKTVNQMRGYEGAGAHLYFSAIRSLLPEEWGFSGRRKRPPTDPFNALISYGYGVLHSTLYTLIMRQRLNPWLGTLHESNSRHPALVADMMEPFRALLVDSVALNALLNLLTPADFLLNQSNDLPCQMSESTRQRYLGWLHNKFRSRLTHPITGQLIDYHRLLQWQVWHYGQYVMGNESQFRGFKSR